MTTKKISVAIADDHHLWRKEFADMLEGEGFLVPVRAIHGKDLLEQLANTSCLPDVCLSDIEMPVMDGYETVRQVKQRYPTIKIIAFSGSNDPYRVQEIKACGADAFIRKGSALEDYTKLLEELYNTFC